MFPKLVKVEWLALKLELHIMPALKFGLIYLIMPNVTFGHWDVSCTRWHPLDLHSWPMTSTPSKRGSLLDTTIEYPSTTLNSWKILLDFA